jgi:ketosteroid isomerase-like protein
MQKRYSVPAAVAIAVFLVGCSEAPPPAPDNRAVDAKAIRDVETAWVQSYTTKDVDKIALNYADDASIFMPDAPVITGLPAIKAALKSMVADKNFSLTFSADKVEVSKAGDLAYSQGAYTATMTNLKTKKVVTETGKLVTVYKKQPIGAWKAVADIFNADAPAAPAKHRASPAPAPHKHHKSTARKR